MKTKITFLARSLSVVSLVLFPAGASFAALDKFDPYAFIGGLYDSNIFRTADNEDNDKVARFGAGFESDWKLSRQHILLRALADRAEYDTFSNLSNTRIDAAAAWRWQVGNLWRGNLEYGYIDELASFNQFRTRQKDTRTTQRVDFEAGYQIHPDWELVGGAGYSDVSYDKRKRLDRETGSGLIEVQYRNTRRTRVGVRTQFTDNSFKNKQNINGILVDNDFDETEISAVFYWEGTGKSNFEARWGYTDVNYSELDDRDFKGSTGRLTHLWQISGKTRLETSVWRETDSLYNEITTYVLSKGIRVIPTWSATSKITVSGNFSYINDDFKGENDIRAALGGQRRDDDTWVAGINLGYNVLRNANLSLGFNKAKRDSSQATTDYDYYQVNAEAKVRF